METSTLLSLSTEEPEAPPRKRLSPFELRSPNEEFLSLRIDLGLDVIKVDSRSRLEVKELEPKPLSKLFSLLLDT